MDWARLEIPGERKTSRSGRRIGEASFRFFFPPNGAKSLNVTEDSPRREDIEIEEEFCGANVQFFSSQRCEKSNRQPSEIQSMLKWKLINLSGRE